MGIRDESVPQGFLRVLRRLRPDLKREQVDVQAALAYLAWVSQSKSRAHKSVEGHMTIPYQELAKRFGRDGFWPLNERLQMFDFEQQWSAKNHLTRPFRLKPDIEEAVGDYLMGWRRRMRKVDRALIGMDGKQLRQIPQAIASKDTEGITAKAWNRAKVKNLVPVDLELLTKYARRLERMLDDQQPDLFIKGDPEDYRYRLETVGRIMDMARHRDGRWYVAQRYVESASGRLYGKGINLQTVPRSVKEAALHGLWEYDFANCHYSILYQRALEEGVDCPAIQHYLGNKKQQRRRLMEDLRLEEDAVKTCLIALIYGSRFSHLDEDAIPSTIGQEAALRLYRHRDFRELKKEVAVAGKKIISRWPRSRRRLQNDYGKWISQDAGQPQILAHLLQGVEAKMLEVARKLYPEDILLLQHDGFASAKQLDTGRIAAAIREATGYKMVIEEQRISLSPDLGLG